VGGRQKDRYEKAQNHAIERRGGVIIPTGGNGILAAVKGESEQARVCVFTNSKKKRGGSLRKRKKEKRSLRKKRKRESSRTIKIVEERKKVGCVPSTKRGEAGGKMSPPSRPKKRKSSRIRKRNLPQQETRTE